MVGSEKVAINISLPTPGQILALHHYLMAKRKIALSNLTRCRERKNKTRRKEVKMGIGEFMFEGLEWLGHDEDGPDPVASIECHDLAKPGGFCGIKVERTHDGSVYNVFSYGFRDHYDPEKAAQINELIGGDRIILFRPQWTLNNAFTETCKELLRKVRVGWKWHPVEIILSLRELALAPMSSSEGNQLSWKRCFPVSTYFKKRWDKVDELWAVLEGNTQLVEIWIKAIQESVILIGGLEKYSWVDANTRLEWVGFREGKNGAILGRTDDGKISFPERRGIIPKDGDRWLVAIVGTNLKGSVNFLRLVSNKEISW
ncbi:MAG: hypothetical protein WCT08_02610 [Patescibacteria group bacterium]|jgi:hypothetical protein